MYASGRKFTLMFYRKYSDQLPLFGTQHKIALVAKLNGQPPDSMPEPRRAP